MKIGIDLGGSHIGIGVVDENNNLIESVEKYFTEEEKKDVITVIGRYIIDTVWTLEKKYEIEKIGIAVPGVTKDGKILKAVNLGIYDYDIVESLGNFIKYPITIRNDAKCACLAEYDNIVKNRPNLKDMNMLFLIIGTGIGGGVIYNGELLEGHQFEGYEFGHMVIKENGLPCKCGKYGCFEKYGSILEYKKRVKQKLNLDENVNKEALRKIMEENKDKLLDINKRYISDLALGISNLINIFEPDIVILGGGYTHFNYIFEKDLKRAILNSNLLFNKREYLDLRMANLENDAGIIGATI